jgi:hypothetical protein
MATTTPKLGLIKPDFVDVVDVSELNDNMDVLDDALTDSSTLDDLSGVDLTSPTTGQLLQYDGTDWVNVGQADAGAIPVFADAAARTTAIPSPSEGMVTYREDDDTVEVFDGSAFVPVGASPAILQVVSTVKTDTQASSTAASSFTAVSGLTATLTPSSTSSKVLVTVHAHVGSSYSGGVAGYGFRLTRNGTEIALADSAGNRISYTSIQGWASSSDLHARLATITFLDSPSTTSAVTYGINMGNTDNNTRTLYVNRNENDTDDVFRSRTVSTITAMEVAG